jgi:carbon monoxide dehydrogenase subunit G
VRVRAETTLPATIEASWSALTDWEGQADWMSDVSAVRVLTPHRRGIGVRVEVMTRVIGVPLFTDLLEVVEWRPPRRLVMRHSGLVHGTGEWSLEPVSDGSRFRWSEDVCVRLPVLGKLALFVYRPIMRGLMRRSVSSLRRVLAGSPP